MAWKRKAIEWRAETLAICDVPFEIAKENAVTLALLLSSGINSLKALQIRGSEGRNFVGDNISQATTPLQEYHLKMAAGSIYSGSFPHIPGLDVLLTLHPFSRCRHGTF